MVFKNAHFQLFSVYNLYVISTMVFIDLRNLARNSSAGNWLSGTFSAKEERFLSISPLFSVFISTMYPKDVHPFVQSGHHQMFASAWGELLFFPNTKCCLLQVQVLISMSVCRHKACRNERTSIYEVRRKPFVIRGFPPNSLIFKFRRLFLYSCLRRCYSCDGHTVGRA